MGGSKRKPGRPTKLTPEAAMVTIEKFVNDRVICAVAIRGTTILTSFPKKVILHYDMNIGDNFWWEPTEIGIVKISDCSPVYESEELSVREIADMIDFIEDGE